VVADAAHQQSVIPNFLALTEYNEWGDNNSVLVNPVHIIVVSDSEYGNGCRLHFRNVTRDNDDDTLYPYSIQVIESCSDIKKKLKKLGCLVV
jgi:hypothetical protein